MVTPPVAQPALVRAVPLSARIRAAIEALALGTTTFVSRVKVRRVTLFAYNVAGTYLHLDEVAEEVAYLSAERESVQMEPSLYRAAEVVGRQLLTGPRGLSGSFRVRTETKLGHTVQIACWSSHAWGDTLRDDRTALDDLATWARDMGLRASRVGCEVIATYPIGPAVTKASPRTEVAA